MFLIPQHIFRYSIVLFIIITVVGCKVFDPAEELPSYIKINAINLTTDYATQGTTSNSITDAWVFVDEKFIGAYELPATFPLLYEGTHTLRITGGIQVNNVPSVRSQYPFYASYETTLNLEKTKVSEINPVVTYTPKSNIIWKEDFEQAGISIVKSGNSDTSMQAIIGNAFEGAKCGAVYLNDNYIHFEGLTSVAYSFPTGGAAIYLEMNYKSDIQFSVGVYAYDAQGSGLQQLPSHIVETSSEWKKIYIEIGTAVSSVSNAIAYKIYFDALKTTSGGSNSIFIDNIKVVY